MNKIQTLLSNNSLRAVKRQGYKVRSYHPTAHCCVGQSVNKQLNCHRSYLFANNPYQIPHLMLVHEYLVAPNAEGVEAQIFAEDICTQLQATSPYQKIKNVQAWIYMDYIMESRGYKPRDETNLDGKCQPLPLLLSCVSTWKGMVSTAGLTSTKYRHGKQHNHQWQIECVCFSMQLKQIKMEGDVNYNRLNSDKIL